MASAAQVEREQVALRKRLETQLKTQPCNLTCADCASRLPRWASTNLGIFICTNCSGIHRGLGVHISKVRSCALDKWTPELVSAMENVGNARANAYWERAVPAEVHRPAEGDMKALDRWIRDKYERGLYKDRSCAPPDGRGAALPPPVAQATPAPPPKPVAAKPVPALPSFTTLQAAPPARAPPSAAWDPFMHAEPAAPVAAPAPAPVASSAPAPAPSLTPSSDWMSGMVSPPVATPSPSAAWDPFASAPPVAPAPVLAPSPPAVSSAVSQPLLDLFSSHPAPPAAAAPQYAAPALGYGGMDPGLASLGLGGGMAPGMMHPAPAMGGFGAYSMPQAVGGYGAHPGMHPGMMAQPGMQPVVGYGMQPGMQPLPGMHPGMHPGMVGQPYGGQPHDLGGLMQGMQIASAPQPTAAAARPLPLSALGKMGSGADFSL